MFPSGSVLSPDDKQAPSITKLGCTSATTETWLHSSTYVQNPPLIPSVNEVVSPKRSSTKPKTSTRNKSRRVHSATPAKKHPGLHKAIFLEDIPGLKQLDAYRLDRSCNREIYTFGSIFEKHVARFRIKPKSTILGFSTLRVCDLFDNSPVPSQKGVKKSRYFSKHSRAIMGKPTQRVFSGVASENPKDMLLLKIDLESQPSTSSDKSDLIMTLCEELNRQVYNQPNDLNSWLRLIDIQAKEATFLHVCQSQFSTAISDVVYSAIGTSDRLMILKKQLSMVDRALTSNPGCLPLKMLTIRIGELAAELEAHGASSVPSAEDLFQPERIARDWAQLAFTYPQLVYVWRGYLAHLMSKYASPLSVNQTVGGGLFARIDGIYKRALSTLSGIISGRLLSHRPQPDTAEQTIDFLADYCHWLVQAGHAERALALWQAVVEFNCFRPSELIGTPTDQCMLEMELYWNSGAPRFGQPGSDHWCGWYRVNRQGRAKVKECKAGKKPKKPSGLYSLEEVQSDLTPEQLHSKWVDVAERLKSISNSCEDALIQCTNDSLLDEAQQKLEFEVVPAVLSSAVATDQWVRRGAVPSLTGRAPIGKSRAVMYCRGKAWVGLERAREAVGWLPSDVLNHSAESTQEEEDPERLVLFDDIKTCILELHSADGKNMSNDNSDKQVRTVSLQQRLLLYCLEFLGAYEPSVASKYQLPPDLRILHDISHVGPVDRQNLSPFLSSNFSSVLDGAGPSKDKFPNFAGSHQDIWIQARRIILDTAILHAAHIPSWSKTTEEQWLASIGRIRFHVAVDRMLDGMQAYNLPSKTVINTWRHFGRAVMGVARNQHNLDLWVAYASGFWRAAILSSTYSTESADVGALLTEARRIFDTTLTTYPVPSESTCPATDGLGTPLADFYGTILAARLKVIQHYVDFELGVSPGAGGSNHLMTCETRALQLLVYGATGGDYSPPDCGAVLRPSTLVKASHAYGKWLECVWRTVVSLPEDSRLDPSTHKHLVNSLTVLSPLLAYLSMMYDLMTNDQQGLVTSLPSLISVLRRVDHLRLSLAHNSRSRDTRWSEEPNEAQKFSQRACSRAFIALAVGGLGAFCALRQRNRRQLLCEFFRIWQHEAGRDESSIPIDLLFPTQLAYLVPARVALEKSLLPLSLANASSCHGLLPPLFLAHLIQQLNRFKEQVAAIAAQSRIEQTVAGGSRSSVTQHHPDLQQLDCIESNSKMLSGHQLDLYMGCLPLALDLFLLSLELERWTSLIAGSSMEASSVCMDSTSGQRVRNAFERAVRASPFVAPILSEHGNLYHIALASCTPSFWASHIRLVVWRAYMAFGWMSGTYQGKHVATQDPRQRRQAVKAVFYRAIEDIPWAKVLYTDLVRYCPEDVEEVVDLLSERELRLRTPLEEVDLLLSSKPVTD